MKYAYLCSKIIKMRIINQISEDTFVIKMENSDLKCSRPNVSETYVAKAGTSIQIEGMNLIYVNPENGLSAPIYGKFAFASNCIYTSHRIQIGMTRLREGVLPILEALTVKDTSSEASYFGTDVIHFYKDGIKLVQYRLERSAIWQTVTQDIFENYVYPNIINKN